MKIMFLCDGLLPKCVNKQGGKGPVNCYRNGGDCWHTSDPEHAINFERHLSSTVLWEKTPYKKPPQEYPEAAFDTATISELP